jgi:hypothetical protein
MALRTERRRGWFMGGGGAGFIERQGFPGRGVGLAGRVMWFIRRQRKKTIAFARKIQASSSLVKLIINISS